MKKLTKHETVGLAWAALLVVGIFVLTGCWWSRPSAPTAPRQEKQGPETRAERRIETADERIARLDGELVTARSEKKAAEEARVQERLAWVRSLIMWLTGLCAVGAIVMGGVAFYLKSMTAASVAGALLVMIVVAQGSNLLLDHIRLAIGVSVAAMVLVGGYLLATGRNLREALARAIQVGESLKPKVETAEEAIVRRGLQTSIVGKYHRTIDQVRAELGHLKPK